MNRMTGIVLMIIGVLVFLLGVAIYSASNKKIIATDSGSELNKIIEMAIADGVLTANERKIIKQISIEKHLDFDDIITNVEQQLSELKTDSETELIDYKKRKGDDFEKFVVQKFDKKYFRIKEWAGDKYINGVYADTTPQPDLLLQFTLKQVVTEFSVECKWRQNLYKNGIEFAKKAQFERYKSFERTQKHPVFIAIGIGGKAASPEQLYIVPLRDIDDNFISIEKLEKYEKNINSSFFFDVENKELN